MTKVNTGGTAAVYQLERSDSFVHGSNNDTEESFKVVLSRAGTFYPRSEHQFEREVKGEVVKLTHGHDFLLHPTAFVGTLDLL